MLNYRDGPLSEGKAGDVHGGDGLTLQTAASVSREYARERVTNPS
jgi:hypothetical protein